MKKKAKKTWFSILTSLKVNIQCMRSAWKFGSREKIRLWSHTMNDIRSRSRKRLSLKRDRRRSVRSCWSSYKLQIIKIVSRLIPHSFCHSLYYTFDRNEVKSQIFKLPNECAMWIDVNSPEGRLFSIYFLIYSISKIPNETEFNEMYSIRS